MKINIFGLLLVMAFLLGIIFAVVTLYAAEQFDERKKDKEKKRLVEEGQARKKFEVRQKMMCEKTRLWNMCPGVCEKCSWGFNYDER